MPVQTDIHGVPVGNLASTSGSDYTVSYLLNNPRVIERRLGEATDYEYWANELLPNAGETGGGVVIYEEWDPRYEILDRKPEELAPDDEVPLAGSDGEEPKVVRAKVDGLGYAVTRDQENRNQRWVIDRKERGLAHSMADNFNARAVKAVTDSIAASSRTQAAGSDWSALVIGGSNPTPAALWPHSGIALIQAQQRQQRIPFIYDGMIAHALDVWRLQTIYTNAVTTNSQVAGGIDPGATHIASLSVLAARLGLKKIISDNTGQVPRGRPILFSQGNVGGTAWEQPLMVEVVDEPRRRRKVVQATGSAAYFVDNPYGLLQLTGVANADGGS